MIDAQDTQTQALPLEQPAKRGRPATGKALSNADRQRAYRERQKAQRNEIERELHNAEATLRVDEGFSEGLWEELEQSKARIRELEELVGRLAGDVRIQEKRAEAAEKQLTQRNEKKRRHRDEPAAELPDDEDDQDKRYVVEYKKPGSRKWERTADNKYTLERAQSVISHMQERWPDEKYRAVEA